MVPEDSRTSVQHTTCSGLTAGFGMRPGVSRKLWPLSPHVVLLVLDAGEESIKNLLHTELPNAIQ